MWRDLLKRRYARSIIIVFISIACNLSLLLAAARAEARPLLRVGIHQFGSDITEDSSGNFHGMETDFMQALGLKRVILMGHSHGGRVSLEIASRKDLPLTVTRLILMDAAGVLPKKTLKQKLRQRQYKICRKILEMPLCRVLYPDALENLRRSHGSADYQNASPLMRQTLVKCVNTDMTPKMPEVSQPALLIWGENDTATPIADGETMERLMPNAALIKVPNAGHYSYLDQWPLVSRVLASYLSGKEG